MADSFKVNIVADNTEAAKLEMQMRVERALTAVGIQVATNAREEIQKNPSRIDTGLLRNSITHAVNGGGTAIGGYSADRPSKYTGKIPDPGTYGGTMPQGKKGVNTVYIGTNVEYAEYVHEGFHLPSGKKVAPNRFLKNAIENNKDEIISIIKQELT